MAKQIIYFVHPLKTGGTSIRGFFNKHKIPYESPDHSPFIPERLERLQKAHDRVVLLTTLRDPVEQIMSLYSYGLAATTTKLHQTIKGVNFSKWIRTFPDIDSYFVRYFNSQRPFEPNGKDNLTGVSDSVKDAQAILGKFDYVIDMSNLTVGVNKMMSDIGVKARFDLHLNKSKKQPISDADVELIKKRRSKDYELIRKFNIKEKH